MKEELISFETAKLAKEKGFNIRVVNSYAENQEIKSCYGFHEFGDTEKFNWNNKSTRHYDHFYSAPTQSLLQRWLRDNYKIIVTIMFELDSFEILIDNGYHQGSVFISTRKTYEEALEIGLIEALKLIACN